jgi:hypothetical protein
LLRLQIARLGAAVDADRLAKLAGLAGTDATKFLLKEIVQRPAAAIGGLKILKHLN